jgi:branched-chain amino acid transport system ATP-binding protein
MLLNLNDATVYYGTAIALKGVTIEVEEGSVISIIGANGAGKSTLLKAIAGLVPLHSGEKLFLGEKINDTPVNKLVRRGIVYVPEGRRLFPYMSVMDNLKLGAFLRNDKSDIALDLEGVFNLFPRLKERTSQKAGSLSGGEQQMLAIGRALMAKPRLLMMDEPSLGLAPLIIEQLASVIEDINSERGLTVLLVEQNAGFVAKVSQRCYILEVGKVVLEGDTRELIRQNLLEKALWG